ncbi:shikimate dehydrogenase [Pseudovibrio exalbescens]|uniref:Shikimate dehydrogenase (NADP(+)) n=1 Tax=Pseudovibrio exalbescens TaxID=197461 RepID=A0A1U7JIL8_9HYPH|nr:shikimate dehydrogenase [Pseudovibrio exalbescens]OKL44593.1 shikimate dehydrogenase [Pseudovibrio exalbescens]
MRKAAVTGHPVKHSRSPLIHGYWLKTYGIEGKYGLVDVPPHEALTFFKSLPEHQLVGCNVTIPNKEIALEAADIVDDAAREIGAVNTLWIDETGKLQGSNTDAVGFLGNLDQAAPGWDTRKAKAVVLGAGGAARAILWALKQRNYQEIVLINRTLEKAEALQHHFGKPIRTSVWETRSEELENCDLLVNTTALGMTGQRPLDLDLDRLPSTAVVTDIVYTPLMTDLLAAAKARGNQVVDGLGMLLHQAVPGFEKWFGIHPVVTPELRSLILKDMDQ